MKNINEHLSKWIYVHVQLRVAFAFPLSVSLLLLTSSWEAYLTFLLESNFFTYMRRTLTLRMLECLVKGVKSYGGVSSSWETFRLPYLLLYEKQQHSVLYANQGGHHITHIYFYANSNYQIICPKYGDNAKKKRSCLALCLVQWRASPAQSLESRSGHASSLIKLFS